VNKEIEAFLKDLSDISRKYDVYIGGCGCCGSPWVSGPNSSGVDIQWDDSKGYVER
jgi:hypothetical protein